MAEQNFKVNNGLTVNGLSGNPNSLVTLGNDGTFMASSVTSATSGALDGRYVKLTGNESIGGQKTFTGETVFNNNVYINGTQFTVNTQTVSASDNVIEINGGEVGPGVTKGFAGLRVDRGSANDFMFVFDEVRDRFVVGTVTSETSGQVATLQVVATREDSPINGGYAVYNSAQNRFDTVTSESITGHLDARYVNVNGDTMTGDLHLGVGTNLDGNGMPISVNLFVGDGNARNIDDQPEAMTSGVYFNSTDKTGARIEHLKGTPLMGTSNLTITSPGSVYINADGGSEGYFQVKALDRNIIETSSNKVELGSSSDKYITLNFADEQIDVSKPLVVTGLSGSANRIATVNASGTIGASSLTTASLGIQYNTIASSANVTLDFSNVQTISVINTLATNCTFATSNRATGRVYGLRIKSDASARTLTFPAGWNWMSTAPTATTASKWLVITLECYGTNDSDILADWKVQS